MHSSLAGYPEQPQSRFCLVTEYFCISKFKLLPIGMLTDIQFTISCMDALTPQRLAWYGAESK
jgi:hypothetical protein